MIYGMLPADYGEAVSGGADSTDDYLNMLVKGVSVYTEQRGNTPEELQARIDNLKQMKKRMPTFAAVYDARILRWEGRRAAVDREERETTEWRTLGQTASKTSILVGIGAFALLLALSYRVATGGRRA